MFFRWMFRNEIKNEICRTSKLMCDKYERDLPELVKQNLRSIDLKNKFVLIENEHLSNMEINLFRKCIKYAGGVGFCVLKGNIKITGLSDYDLKKIGLKRIVKKK